jgi:hypothetical protein
MSNDNTRPNTFLVVLGGGAVVVHALAVFYLLLKAVSSGGRVDGQSFLISSFFTGTLLVVGLFFLYVSHVNHLFESVCSYVGAGYTLLGVLFFSAGAFDSAVQFSRGSLWADRAAGLTFAGLFLSFAIGGFVFMGIGEKPQHKWLFYLFATIYVVLCLSVVCEYVFGGVTAQRDILGDQFQVFIFGGLYLFGLYLATGMGDTKKG